MIVTLSLVIVALIAYIIYLKVEGRKFVTLKENMPEDFNKHKGKRRTQIATMLFQNELHAQKAIKYDYRKRKITLTVKK